jgi:hypothetical protein
MIMTRRSRTLLAAACTAGLVLTGGAAPAFAGDTADHDRDGGFTQTNLVSNIPDKATHTDPNLHNPWGISTAPGLPLWVSDNGTGLSTCTTAPAIPRGR